MTVHFFFNDTATTEIYTLSLHDALPISQRHVHAGGSKPLQLSTVFLQGDVGLQLLLVEIFRHVFAENAHAIAFEFEVLLFDITEVLLGGGFNGSHFSQTIVEFLFVFSHHFDVLAFLFCGGDFPDGEAFNGVSTPNSIPVQPAEEREEAIIIPLWNRADFVVVATGTVHRHAEECLTGGHQNVIEKIGRAHV